MSELLTLFYVLPMDFIAAVFSIAAFLFLKLHACLEGRRWFRWGTGILLAAWFALALWMTVLNRTPGAIFPPELVPFHSYRKMIATGNVEILRTNFMNAALFFPAGLLTASLLPRRGRLLTVAVLFLLFSLGIEYAQFRWALGEPEMDDIIHNTLGALLGALPMVPESTLFRPQQ